MSAEKLWGAQQFLKSLKLTPYPEPDLQILMRIDPDLFE
jgi:hypothetical protein